MVGRPVTLDEDLWGRAPTEVEVADALLSAQRESERRLAEIRAASVTVDMAAARTGFTLEAVAAAIAAGQLLTVPSPDGQALIPAWQLATAGDSTCSGPALAGIAEVARAFPGSAVAFTLWACRRCPDLAGRTPAQVLADGNSDAAVSVARTVTAAGW